ncbi:GNAT family N-acetyltransferase [Methanobrevibacter filiformis]|uniref:Acetyltransferase (GNAT) family protein n=1 Tax=Methanobrevibacter filiformis TaxID=55758 RepID=A0A166DLJ8_9EURY|nr:GNAT family N-acetyltransferase [Methanobrevibacter filiformis]KZX15725.1 acetyltransferase (GNAT) family protein [Methanobrevibacter filiformis]
MNTTSTASNTDDDSINYNISSEFNIDDNVVIEKASFEDMEEILNLQKLAFISEAEIHEDFSIKPLKQSLKEVQDEYKSRYFFKARFLDSNVIVGSIRIQIKKDTTCIEKLIVDPKWQGRGIAKKLLAFIEDKYKNNKFELFTSHKSAKNIHLYKSIGYKVFKIEKESEKFYFIFFRKTNNF